MAFLWNNLWIPTAESPHVELVWQVLKSDMMSDKQVDLLMLLYKETEQPVK